MRSIADPQVLARLSAAIEATAKARGLPFTRTPSGDPQVELRSQLRLSVRDSGSFLAPSIAVIRSRVGDGTFDRGETLSIEHFVVTSIADVNTWTATGSNVPTYTDAELANVLLDERV